MNYANQAIGKTGGIEVGGQSNRGLSMPARDLDVPLALGLLETELDALEASISELTQRLQPVKSLPPPTAPCGIEEVRVSGGNCNISSSIRALAERVRLARDNVAGNISLLEI